mmetsp:Transcript_33968/g.95506  ORF Transcript_33968/g.95506 Transcript_33968/m.95506 type:complete len:1067 (+) Transcript_33968:81-3281(+)
MREEDVEALCGVLRHSYSASTDERRQAEAAIEAAERTPGLLPALLRVATEPRAEPLVRQAAAIQLKNQVLKWWAPTGDKTGKGYSEEDKAAVRSRLIEGVGISFGVPGVVPQLVETFRLAALHDFPEGWPGVLETLLGLLRSDDTAQTYCALMLLRKLFKQLEMRPVAHRDEMETLCVHALPTLHTLMPTIARAASQPGAHCAEAFDMLKLVLKCFYSAVHMAIGEHVRQSIDAWMPLLFGVAELPATLGGVQPATREAQETSPAAKCRKWVFHIFFRFFHRHGSVQKAVNGMEEFAELWSSKYKLPTAEACLKEACAKQRGSWVPKRSLALAFLCLAEACSSDTVYEVMRPALMQLLEGGIFPCVRFNSEDVALWEEDPEEFVRQLYNDFNAFEEPRIASVDLVERLLRHRKKDILVPLLQFCQTHLDAHKRSPTDPELCANKYGALLLLGSMGSQLLNLDPAQGERKKKPKKSGPKPGLEAVSVEELLNNHVRPELSGPVAFLRLRACWLYEKLAPKARLGPPGATKTACGECLRLAVDPELPVRVQAVTSLQAFLQREGDEEIRSFITENLPNILDRLLRILAEVQCEEIAETLETLVSEFPNEIVPYAIQLVRQLAAHFFQAVTAEDDSQENEVATMGTMQTIVSILQACGSSKDGRVELFAGMIEPLLPMLRHIIRPDGMDFYEEALEILTYLTFYGPSPIPAPLWALFPQVYQSVCGHATASLPLPEVLAGGWAPDFISNIIAPVENFISRGPPEAFLTGVWVEAGLPYPEMVFNMFRKVLHMPGAGSEDDCARAAELATAVFTNLSAPVADEWLPRYFDELWRRWQTAETADLRRSVLAAFATMLWYNVEAFLRCTEERQCLQQVFEAWMQHVKVIKGLPDRKVFVLGFLRLFQLSCAQSFPAALAPGVPHLVAQLVTQTREIIRLREKQAKDKEDMGSDEESDSDDAISDEDEEERMERVLQKLESKPDTGEDDDDDSDEDDFDFDGLCGGVMEERCTPLDRFDELELLQQTLQQSPPAMQKQLEVWLGADVLQKWAADLSAEAARRAAAAAMKPATG